MKPSDIPISSLLRDVRGIALLAVVACLAGVVINEIRSRPVSYTYRDKKERLEDSTRELDGVRVSASPTSLKPASVGMVSEIGLEEFRAGVENSEVIVLDARPAVFHSLGHVPGAVSLPRERFEETFERQRERIGAFKDKTVMVYCSDVSCEDSHLVAEALARLGFVNVKVYRGGWNGWTEAGLPEERP